MKTTKLLILICAILFNTANAQEAEEIIAISPTNKAGLLDEASWQSYRAILRFSLGLERGRKWWDSMGKEFFAVYNCIGEIFNNKPVTAFSMVCKGNFCLPVFYFFESLL